MQPAFLQLQVYTAYWKRDHSVSRINHEEAGV